MPDVGDYQTPTLTVTPFDGTTAVTCVSLSPAGASTALAAATADGGNTWAAAPARYTTPGWWVLLWTVTGKGAGTEAQRVYARALPGPGGPDRLADPADLVVLLGAADLDLARAGLLVECATAVVQAAADGQRIVAVTGDQVDLVGTTGNWLTLPQIPVTAVTAVTIDGVAISSGDPGSGGSLWRRPGSGHRLWRGDGWQTYAGEPSTVNVIYDHGYAAGDQELQLARSAVLGLARTVADNPSGATAVRIDDYAVAYEAMAAAMDGSPTLRRALQRAYAERAGWSR